VEGGPFKAGTGPGCAFNFVKARPAMSGFNRTRARMHARTHARTRMHTLEEDRNR
jgi:hypothetical protein